MKNALLWTLFSMLFLTAPAQQIREESTVINIEVPIRVFKGSTFVDGLTAEDFEVYEDGRRQKIEAVYLIKKRAIARREEEKKFKPDTGRNFCLFFEMSDYMGQLDDALRYFVNDILVPGDNLVLVTPMKTYRMLSEAIAAKSKNDILKQFRGILRRDIGTGTSEYRSIVQDLEVLARALSQQISRSVPGTPSASSESLFRTDAYASPETEARTVDDLLTQYANYLGQLDNIRMVNQGALLNFAKYWKDAEGQKLVYLFYQREFVPKIDPKILTRYMEQFQDRPDIQQTISGLFDFYQRELNFDPETIKQAFADSAISCHFLFITPPPEIIAGVRLQEQSEDIYAVFKEIALASGGFMESSANPTYLMKNAVEASENYYLLYYSPGKYVHDGKFKEIKVKLKNPDYRLVYRLGYFAR
jgi:hypothetical protein